MKTAEREKRIFEEYGIIIQKKDTIIEKDKIYYTGTVKQFEKYIKPKLIK